VEVIDIETDLFDELARLVLADWPDAFVSAEYVPVPGGFPAVFVTEASNVEHGPMVSTYEGEEGAALTYEVQVAHPTAEGGRATCKAILALLSEHMRALNFARTTCMPLDNSEDPGVYRMVARYTGVVDRFGTHYRR